MKTELFKIVKAKMIRIVDGIKKAGYVARMLTNGTASIDDVVSEASHNTSANTAEIKMALELCMQATAEYLKNGYIVDLGPIGKLYPTTRSKWVEDKEDLDLMFVATDVRYVPSDQILSGVHGATKVWATKADKDKQTTDEAAGADTNNNDDIETVDTSTNNTPSGGDDGLGG